ncbi:hypothetical protein Hypma_005525 [Hypsizygus marmoreus]|uniref:Protein kinase domain-containing protein n=1 Tax=Hypsizygus marmoreus TaxID=39966 RepID=A0A369JWB0_HYPMA|nr:hypothetical protein Hypma_005525 [Hypsizygus marmoreus]
MRVVRLDSFIDSIRWTFREWHAGFPVPTDLDGWTDLDSDEDYSRRLLEAYHAWRFLGPFFASRGYMPYVSRPEHTLLDLFPAPSQQDSKDTTEPMFPFARRGYTSDDDARFDFTSLRVWPARDKAGRDVVIKLISGPEPSMELRIFQWLNRPEARSDPRNISIPVLDHISYNGLQFIVMPRWDLAFEHPFYTVAELMHAIDSLLEGVDFLHENRIAHCDLLVQNTGLNITIGPETGGGRYVRDPAVAMYTIIDFGASFMYPRDIALEEAVPLALSKNGDENPFDVDARHLGNLFSRWIKPAKLLVPGIHPILQDMMIKSPGKCITVRQALERFREFRSSLSPAQLECEIPQSRRR